MGQSSNSTNPDERFWAGKRVLVTGHTGFKGGWLTIWLSRLGAQVTGIGLRPQSNPNLFELGCIQNRAFSTHFCDIRDATQLGHIVSAAQPEIVFHLAAQALVLTGYQDPLETFSTNVQGTANLLDGLRACPTLRVAVMVTTDKVYENPENCFPFREDDRLGGHDPYSASKAASEIVISSYRRSFLTAQGVSVASARAGNVIGGGDWASHRLIPDAVRAWGANHALEVRHPGATRPWQHVLEPLSGYLTLAQRLWDEPSLASSYNFGPETSEAATVREVLEIAREEYGRGDIIWGDSSKAQQEAGWLSLEIAKARQQLGVSPRWNLRQAVKRTMNWYKRQASSIDSYALCLDDIEAYQGGWANI